MNRTEAEWVELDVRVQDALAGEPITTTRIAHRLGLDWDEAEYLAERALAHRTDEGLAAGYGTIPGHVVEHAAAMGAEKPGRIDNPLAGLLYELAGSLAPVGALDDLAASIASGGDWPRDVDNGWLAEWANWTAGRIVDGA